MMQLIGSRIKSLRIEKGFSQIQLAQASNVSASTVTRLERGHGNIALSSLISIIGILGASNELASFFERLVECSSKKRVKATRKTDMPQDAK
jgi:transcriptional regulator with XRE-family HTH domain